MNWLSSLLGARSSRERYTLEQLKYVHAQLERQSTESESGRRALVEACRHMAELMIYGDQHDERFFEYFADSRVLSTFVGVLSMPSGRKAPIASQMLQTLSIMLQNIKQQTSVFFLLSNSRINDLIELELDFEDEEVLAYFISFLKTLSLKLNSSTVQFFFQPAPAGAPVAEGSFPLYTQAIRFARHPESMVRAAVRTLTLNVFSVRDDAVRVFLLSNSATHFLDSIVDALKSQVQALDGFFCTSRHRETTPSLPASANHHMDSAVAELGDLLCYCSDALLVDFAHLRCALASRLWTSFFEAIVFPAIASGSDELQPSSSRSAWADHAGACTVTGRKPSEEENAVDDGSPLPSSCSSSQVPHTAIAAEASRTSDRNEDHAQSIGEQQAHVHSAYANGYNKGKTFAVPSGARNPGYSANRYPACGATTGLYVLSRAFLSLREHGIVNALAAALVSTEQCRPAMYMTQLLMRSSAEDLSEIVQTPPPTFEGLNVRWAGLLECADGGHDGMAFAAASTVVALVKNRNVEDDLLKRSGILPSRHHRNSSSPQDQVHDIPAYMGHDSAEVHVSRSSSSSTFAFGTSSGTSSKRRSQGRNAEQQHRKVGQREALTCALLSYLRRQSVIANAVWTVGWVLRTLMPQQMHLGTAEHKALLNAAEDVTDRMQRHLSGHWADAALPLIESEWTKARQAFQVPSVNDETVAESIQQECNKLENTAREGSFNDAATNVIACCRCITALHMLVSSLKGIDMPHKPPLDMDVAIDAGAGKEQPAEGSELPQVPHEAYECKVAFERGKECEVRLVQLVTGVKSSESAVVANLVLVENNIVRSVAPACGSNAEIDPKHRRWLHVRVRSQPQALIEIANAFSRHEMIDGRWTLAFEDASKCHAANAFAHSAADMSRSVLQQIAKPLLTMQLTS